MKVKALLKHIPILFLFTFFTGAIFFVPAIFVDRFTTGPALWIQAGVGFGVLGFVLFAGLFFAKKDSANGRLLIWQCSTELISRKPLLGYGGNGFTANYMDGQNGSQQLIESDMKPTNTSSWQDCPWNLKIPRVLLPT